MEEDKKLEAIIEETNRRYAIMEKMKASDARFKKQIQKMIKEANRKGE